MQKLGRTGGLKKVMKTITQEANCKIDASISIESQILIFHERLVQIIRPRDQSDRTSFRRIGNWLRRGLQDKTFKPEILETVLRYATEASGPDSRNPAAVFMTIIKNELGYGRA